MKKKKYYLSEPHFGEKLSTIHNREKWKFRVWAVNFTFPYLLFLAYLQ